MKTDIECIIDARANIGESPVWHGDEQRLYWVDIPAGILHRTDPATGIDETWQLPEELGCIALREAGGLLLGMRRGFYFFDPGTQILEYLLDPEENIPNNRLNDGVCARDGRFWAGTMTMDPPTSPGLFPHTGAFYRFDPDCTCHLFRSGIGVTNGLAFSPDGRTMYCADSSADVQTIWAYDYDTDNGMAANERIFATTDDVAGRPDGASVDEDGCYWVAGVGGWQLLRYTPQGKLDRIIDMPIEKPTKPVFGGPRLDVLFVTSIGGMLTPGSEARQPQAGGLFALHVGVSGLPEPRFKG